MPCAAGVEQVRVVFLEVAAELENDSAVSVECPNVDRAVPKALGVNFRSTA